MALAHRRKIQIAAALIALLGAWQGLRYWWYHAYSNGSRTGVIRKISVKGPPFCKYLAGEMVLIGSVPGQGPEIWEFTVYDSSPTNPLIAALHEAEKSARPATLRYVENRSRWWACQSIEYYVTGIE